VQLRTAFFGIPRLTKFIAAILAGLYLTKFLLGEEGSRYYFALIPGYTFFSPYHAWTLLSSGFFEDSAFFLVVNVLVLLLAGKQLEPAWGSLEFLKFIVLVNSLSGISTFFTMILLYTPLYATDFLYTYFWCGFLGVTVGLTIGLKQLHPEKEIPILILAIRVKHLPSIIMVLSLAFALFGKISPSLPHTIFGFYFSWLYLRFFQRKAEIIGDLSESFSFASFFPDPLQPFVSPIFALIFKLFRMCGFGSRATPVTEVIELKTISLSDPIDAERRRAKALKKIEERLAQVNKEAQDSIQVVAQS